MARVASGTIQHEKTGAIAFVPEADGVYLLGVSAGQCAYSVVSATAPIGLYTDDGLSFIYGVERLYFTVPDNVKQFTLTANGSGAETVRVNVFDPEGNQAATGQTTLKERAATIQVTAGEYASDVWSLELTRADEGVLEDHTIRLDPGLAPILSLTPEHIFGIRREK